MIKALSVSFFFADGLITGLSVLKSVERSFLSQNEIVLRATSYSLLVSFPSRLLVSVNH